MASTFSLTGTDLARDIEWERAAKLLDLSPEMLRRIRFPHFECVSQHESRGTAASLYIAASPLSCGRMQASFRVSPEATSKSVAAEWQELRLSAALAGVGGACAAIELHVADPEASEHALWQLAQACAPVIARTLGEVTLLSEDLASATVAGWISHAAAQFGFKILTTNQQPLEFCNELNRVRARAMLNIGALALQDCGKSLAHCSVAVIGTGELGCECLENLRQVGTRVIAVADESGSIIEAGGIEISSLLRHVRAGGLLAEFKEGKHALHAAAIAAGADLLLLCGSEAEATGSKPGSLRPESVVVEGNTSSLWSRASEEIGGREAVVVPGQVVRSAETAIESMIMRPQHPSRNKDEELRVYVAELWESMRKLRKTHAVTLPEALMLLALERLSEWERSSGP